uniref:Uncharacterized protein n=1 Tax=Meloidogyne enterolobii TaxID=390850 RepID=A0A6V7X988_MELEN|nr:unnamed protein product [Meloidogyne enterolobii]
MVNLGSNSGESDSDDSDNEQQNKRYIALRRKLKKQNILLQILIKRIAELNQTTINLTKQVAELKEENIELKRKLNDLMNENKKYKEENIKREKRNSNIIGGVGLGGLGGVAAGAIAGAFKTFSNLYCSQDMNGNSDFNEDTEDEKILKNLITTVNELIDINRQVVNEIEEVKEIKEQQNEIVTILEEDNRRNNRLSKNFSNKKRFSFSGEFAGGCLVGALLGVAACLGALNFPIVGIGLGGGTLAVGIVGYFIFK